MFSRPSTILQSEKILCASVCTKAEKQKKRMKEISSFYWAIYIRNDLKKLSIGGMTAKAQNRKNNNNQNKKKIIHTANVFLSSLPRGKMKSSCALVSLCKRDDLFWKKYEMCDIENVHDLRDKFSIWYFWSVLSRFPIQSAAERHRTSAWPQLQMLPGREREKKKVLH